MTTPTTDTGIEHDIISRLHDIARMTPDPDPATLTSRRAAFVRQIHSYSIGARLDELACQFPHATGEALDELIAEAGELLTVYEPDDCDVPTAGVSEETDARNSRPFPY